MPSQPGSFLKKKLIEEILGAPEHFQKRLIPFSGGLWDSVTRVPSLKPNRAVVLLPPWLPLTS